MKRTSIYVIFLAASLLLSCTAAQVNQALSGVMNQGGSGSLTTNEVAQGLREALKVGISKGSDQASATDGYFKNPLLKILFPPEVQQVETRLRQIGLGGEVDKFVLALNRGAEDAAREAKPIFISAITSMSIQDAWAILRGDKNAATEYLRRTTSDQLRSAFQPVIKNSLEKTYATKYYGDLVNTYNRIPGVARVNPNLDDYATQKAIDGLFILVAQEEANIRENPVARTTDLLKRVFAQAGS
jgi:hypothetical protein